MRVLMVHNRYLIRAGEDACWASETDLLRQRGHEVVHYIRDNQSVEGGSVALGTWRTGLRSVWSAEDYRALRQLIRRRRPDVMAVHNTFPLISPSAYYAAHAEHLPVVQTLHNYRLLCPGATLFRAGRPCELCVGQRVPAAALTHACYRGSRAATGAVTALVAAHWAAGTWAKKVDVFVALTEFARQKFIAGGLPPEKVVVKPNFVHPDPGAGGGQGGYALFVGRLAEEKGVLPMLDAWQRIGGRLPLKVIGDGPLAAEVVARANCTAGVEYLGRQPNEAVRGLMKEAAVLIFPSIWYEGLPVTVIEAFAVGTPVIASDLGAMQSLIKHGSTGRHFRAGDSQDLAAQVEWLLEWQTSLPRLRQETRREYEAKYTAYQNYQMLMRIYELARQARGERKAVRGRFLNGAQARLSKDYGQR